MKASWNNLIIDKSRELCDNVVNSLFNPLRNAASQNPILYQNCIKIISNVLYMSGHPHGYNYETYEDYIYQTTLRMGYSDKLARVTPFYRYSMALRDLFKADEEFLTEKVGLEKLNLPSSREIQQLIGKQFDLLASAFNADFESGAIKVEIAATIKAKIDEVLKTNSLNTQQSTDMGHTK